MTRGQEEQNQAVGGAQLRELRLEDGTVVTASVAIRSFKPYKKSHQVYGYLQFKVHGKTVTKYIGKVTAATRTDALQIGWHLLRQRKLAESFGWSWVEQS